MVLRDSLLYVVAKIIPGVLGIATTSTLTHLLPPSVFGLYGLALIIMNFASAVAFDWIGLSFMRFYETGRADPRTIPTFALLFYGVAGLTAAVVLSAAVAGLVPRDQAALTVLGLTMAWAYSLFELVGRFEVASYRPGRYLAINVTRAVLMLVCTLVPAALTRDVLWTAAGTTTGLSLAVAVAARGRLKFRPGLFNAVLGRQVITFGTPFILSMLLAGLFTSGVRAMVGLLTDIGSLGLYTAAAALSQNVLTVIASGIESATYPLAVRAVERGDAAATRIQLSQNFTVMFAVMAPASLGLALTSAELAHQLVGPAFRPAVAGLVPWMSATVLLGAVRGVYLDHAFQLGKRSSSQVVVSAGAAVLALAGTSLLVPRIGLVGAPVATTAAMALSCVHAWYAGRRAQPMPIPLGAAARVLLGCMAMALAVGSVASGAWFSLALKMCAGGAAYAASALALDILDLRAACRQTLPLAARRLREAFGP